jgi:hypothetical protein
VVKHLQTLLLEAAACGSSRAAGAESCDASAAPPQASCFSGSFWATTSRVTRRWRSSSRSRRASCFITTATGGMPEWAAWALQILY